MEVKSRYGLSTTYFLLILPPEYEVQCNHYNLHSTMFLLIRNRRVPQRHGIRFTFHNVSINSIDSHYTVDIQSYLHSTMFLLILCCHALQLIVLLHLHSTMFLLILLKTNFAISCRIYLHSTMFLLIRVFHLFLRNYKNHHLHSTMFLLIRYDRR